MLNQLSTAGSRVSDPKGGHFFFAVSCRPYYLGFSVGRERANVGLVS